MNINDLIAEVREHDEDAPPAPWDLAWPTCVTTGGIHGDRIADGCPEEAAALIVCYRAAASPLADEVERLTTDLEAAQKERDAQHDRFESALSAALGNPDLGAYPGDPDGAPDLESLIAMVAALRRQRDEARAALAAERAALLAPVDGIDVAEVLRLADAPARTFTAAVDRDGGLAYAAPLLAREAINLRARLAVAERERDEMAAAGRTVVEATDEMREQWAEIEARLESEKATLIATLAAEQGKPEGAPSDRWHVSYDLHGFVWWRGEEDEPPEVECHLSGGQWRWTKPGFESNPYPTALDCMNAADKDLP